jgi:hypothetical protein
MLKAQKRLGSRTATGDTKNNVSLINVTTDAMNSQEYVSFIEYDRS